MLSAEQYWDKVFSMMDKKDKEKNEKQNKAVAANKEQRYHCKNFKKGKDGLCKHYTGDRLILQNCSRYCKLNYNENFKKLMEDAPVYRRCKGGAIRQVK